MWDGYFSERRHTLDMSELEKGGKRGHGALHIWWARLPYLDGHAHNHGWWLLGSPILHSCTEGLPSSFSSSVWVLLSFVTSSTCLILGHQTCPLWIAGAPGAPKKRSWKTYCFRQSPNKSAEKRWKFISNETPNVTSKHKWFSASLRFCSLSPWVHGLRLGGCNRNRLYCAFHTKLNTEANDPLCIWLAMLSTAVWLIHTWHTFMCKV